MNLLVSRAHGSLERDYGDFLSLALPARKEVAIAATFVTRVTYPSGWRLLGLAFDAVSREQQLGAGGL